MAAASGGGPGLGVDADVQDFYRIAGKLSAAGPKVKTALRKRVREAGLELVKEVQAEVMRPPLGQASGRQIPGLPQTRGLRRSIRDGVSLSVGTSTPEKAGVVINARSTRMGDASRKKLLKKYNAEKGWRSPNIGTARLIAAARQGGQVKDKTKVARDLGRWTTQKGRPYFGATIEKHGDVLAAKVSEAINDARKQAGL